MGLFFVKCFLISFLSFPCALYNVHMRCSQSANLVNIVETALNILLFSPPNLSNTVVVLPSSHYVIMWLVCSHIRRPFHQF